jgi:hypothetical protein
MTKDSWFTPPIVIPLGLLIAYLSYLLFLYLH